MTVACFCCGRCRESSKPQSALSSFSTYLKSVPAVHDKADAKLVYDWGKALVIHPKLETGVEALVVGALAWLGAN